jgi:hypothetical protein
MNEFTRTIIKYLQLLLIWWLAKMARYIGHGKSFVPAYEELDTLETIPLSPPGGSNDETLKIQDKNEKSSLTLQLCKQQNLIEEANDTIVRPVESAPKLSPSKRKPASHPNKTPTSLNHSYASSWLEFCNMIVRYVHRCLFSIRSNNSHVIVHQAPPPVPPTTIPRKTRPPPPWTQEDMV